MSPVSQAEAGFEETVDSLERTISTLAEGTAPLEQLVAAHTEAVRLLAEARARLQVLETRAELIAKLIE
ncbi:MAG: exodeoxyribonuclease VII small subunit [Candidatus Dormibacterales bacterium]